MILQYWNISESSAVYFLSLLLILFTRPPRTHLCGVDLNLTYPQNGILPSIVGPSSLGSAPPIGGGMSKLQRNKMLKRTLEHVERAEEVQKREAGRHTKRNIQAQRQREVLKRNLTGRPNGTIDPFYKCDTVDELLDYALNFSEPWGEFFGHCLGYMRL
jgi:carboxypeptidase D